MSDITSILHIGAPKCGSSALQTALSSQPDLRDESGRCYRYTVYREDRKRAQVLRGRALNLAARMSPYGYVSWPNIGGQIAAEPFWTAARGVLAHGSRRGYVPILSNEGWIAHADAFAKNLINPDAGATEVVVFVRPPLEWLNAAYWQWGVWGGLKFDTWLNRPPAQYRLGQQIEAWSRVPGIRLRVRTAKQDVVGAFGDHYRLDLERQPRSNPSAPPALTGFLLRNRRFRPTAHDSAVEFVFQRWCRVEDGGTLWSFKPRQVQRLRDDLRVEVDRMLEAIDPTDAEALLIDTRWRRMTGYHDRLNMPLPDLDDRNALARLDTALREGLERCARAAGTEIPQLSSLPSETAPLEDWDTVIAGVLSALLEADRAYRLGRLSGSRLGNWVLSRLPGFDVRSISREET